jgi:hypothetical protein
VLRYTGAAAIAIEGATQAEASRSSAVAVETERMTDVERDRRAERLRMALDSERAVRPFLNTAYPPCPEALASADSTVICRCE